MRSARALRNTDLDDSSEDSFLDVVANVVGVLIILVMVVGLQASRGILVTESERLEKPASSSADEAGEDLAKLQQKFDEASRQAILTRQNVQEIANRVLAIRDEAKAHDQQRVKLAMHRQVIEEDIEHRRENLDAQRQREFDVQRQLVESQMQLDQLTQEQLTLVSKTDVEEIECVPTPLAKTIDGSAIHLRLRHGLVSIVPFEQLQKEVEYHLDGIRRRLQGRDGIQDTFGPIDGYRLKFVVQKQRRNVAVSGPIAGQIERSNYDYVGEFLPNSEKIGQSVEQALMPGATLSTLLQSHRRERFPVVVWLYTDSFDEFRILKRALWEMHFSVAIRPLEPGAHIRASSRGTKASAQ